MFMRLKTTRFSKMLAELLMLVVGINIALWFEGKFEDFRDGQAEQEYLVGLQNDLALDLEQIDRLLLHSGRKIEHLSEALKRLPELESASPQVMSQTIFEPSSYDFFTPSDFTYRSMQESGDFRLLSDPNLKKGLLNLARKYREIDTLQQNYIQALDDSYIPTIMSGFDILRGQLADPNLLKNQIFRNFFVFALQETQGRVRAYETTRKVIASQLEVITAQID